MIRLYLLYVICHIALRNHFFGVFPHLFASALARGAPWDGHAGGGSAIGSLPGQSRFESCSKLLSRHLRLVLIQSNLNSKYWFKFLFL